MCFNLFVTHLSLRGKKPRRRCLETSFSCVLVECIRNRQDRINIYICFSQLNECTHTVNKYSRDWNICTIQTQANFVLSLMALIREGIVCCSKSSFYHS